MTLFFTYEEIQNIPKDLLHYKPFQVLSKTPDGQRALHPIYQMERKQPKTILRRGGYYLPPHSQRIEWDFLPTEIAQFLKLGRKITLIKSWSVLMLQNGENSLMKPACAPGQGLMRSACLKRLLLASLNCDFPKTKKRCFLWR